MICITDKTKCSGCYACVNICPKDCIAMQEDSEGFRYPVVNTEACINCGLCEKSCPLTGAADGVRSKRKGIKSVACSNKDADALAKSASGGVAHILAEYVIQNGGVVFGVAGDAVTVVRHIMAEEEKDLKLLQNSKYLQSHVDYNYRLAKNQLESGRTVLFTGTPCQIAGLYGYLGKDYDNLITADLVCHGVPSEKVFKKYILEYSEKAGKKVVSMGRDKTYGWRPSVFSFVYEDGTQTVESVHENKFIKGFNSNLYQRPSCYVCPFAKMERVGDITLGDWFGGEKFKELDSENKGLSMIVINSPKGEKYYDLIKPYMKTSKTNRPKAAAKGRFLYCLPKFCLTLFMYYAILKYRETCKPPLCGLPRKKGAYSVKKISVVIDPAMKDGYIPAPYVLEEGDNINDFYLEPVLF